MRRACALRFWVEPFPLLVVGGGFRLVEATYRISRALVGSERGPAYQFTGSPRTDLQGPQVFETHPTIGLAILGEMVDPADVPNRRRMAKSDFYWERWGGERVEAVVGVPGIAAVRDHEYRAAIYALGVGLQITGESADGSSPMVIGLADVAANAGVYVLIGPPHPSWNSGLSPIRCPE